MIDLPPIVKSIDVRCCQKRAFETFIHRMDTWWPLASRSMSLMWNEGRPAKGLTVDARLGGRIVEQSPDGGEYHWATITQYLPYSTLKLDFHMGLAPETASLVEIDCQIPKHLD